MKHRKFSVSTLAVVSRMVMAAMLALGFASMASAKPTEITDCQPITSSGSYVLINNLTTDTYPEPCISIGPPSLDDKIDVTIDLNGFTISVHPAIGTGDHGPNSVVVRNGVAAGSLILHHVYQLQVKNMIVYGDSYTESTTGIKCSSKCIITGNTVYGFSTGIDATGLIIGNSVNANWAEPNGWGIRAGSGSTVSNNVTTTNKVGFVIDCPSHVTGNTGYGNSEQDILIRHQELCKGRNNIQVDNSFEKILFE